MRMHRLKVYKNGGGRCWISQINTVPLLQDWKGLYAHVPTVRKQCKQHKQLNTIIL